MSRRYGSVDRDQREDWVRKVIERLYEEYRPFSEGEPADYIPELANVDPDASDLGRDHRRSATKCRRLSVGDAGQRLTIQSLSKPLLYGLALETHGREPVMRREALLRPATASTPSSSTRPTTEPDGERRSDRCDRPGRRRRHQ